MPIGQRVWCRNFATKRIWVATVVASSLFGLGASKTAVADSRDGGPTTSDQLIDQAGKAKADGRSALAYSLLHQVVRIEPENALARWQLGQVQVDREWVSVEEAQRRAENDPRQEKYRDRKEVAGDSPQGQLSLARWCRGNKLDDEALVHWTSVLSVDPKNKEALHATGMRWRDGELKTISQIREARQNSADTKQANRRWATKVAGWMRALADRNEKAPTAVIEEIRAVDDIGAIPAFEDVTLKGPQSANEKNTAVRRLSLAFVKALNQMHEEEATNSLLRHAVMSWFADVRVEAISELRYRPLADYVPTLLDNFLAPMQTSYRVVNDPDGSTRYLHSVYREGPFEDWAYRTERTIYQPGSAAGFATMLTASVMNREAALPGLSGIGKTPARAVSRAGAARSARNYEREIADGEQKVADANEKTAALNERIVSVLTGTTEQSFGSEPRPWWDWWADYTDYQHGGSRPVNTTVDSSYDYIIPPMQAGPSSVECFVRGTPVWTKIGLRPIESLTAGDLVLSQDVNTGEIRYKPVLARTLRPAGPTVEVATEDEKFRSTRGHPLWVAGAGWKMSKELSGGMVLQTLAGSGQVRSVQSAADAETYNLVVADFNTYFIGSSGVLAHDNTPRRPTQAVLPGIVKK
jgi:hypothetical protein